MCRKRLYFRNYTNPEGVKEILELFEFDDVTVTNRTEIEICIDEEENTFGIYKNENNSSILIQDTTDDEVGLMKELEKKADEIEIY